MPAPVPPVATRWWRYVLLGALALGLTMICASHVVAGATGSSASATSSMSSMMASAAPAGTEVGQVPPPGMAGTCDATCASETTATVCSVLVIVGPLTLLILLWTRRRTPFLGSLPRTRLAPMVSSLRGRWRGHVPLSPATLCLWRV